MSKARLFFTAVIIATAASIAEADVMVPFYDYPLKAGERLSVLYNFDPHTQTVSCYLTPQDQASVSAHWFYKDKYNSQLLPVDLMDNANFPGLWAESSGVITLSGAEAKISCVYLKHAETNVASNVMKR